MKPLLSVLLPTLLSLGPVNLPSASPSRAFCSLMTGGELDGTRNTLFIATSTGDSLPASGQPSWNAGATPENLLRGPAFSQLMRVDRISTYASPDLRKAIKSAKNRVLVIPWAYGPDCRSATFEGGALWLPSGTRALFGAGLRPRGDWVGGVPTFDAGHPRNVPYPVADAYVRETKDKDALSPDDLLSFLDSVPRTQPRLDRRTDFFRYMKRSAAVLRWAERHPDQAERWPVADRVAGAMEGRAVAAFDTVSAPFAGTYRFVIDIPGRDSIVFFGRSPVYPTNLLWHERGVGPRKSAEPYGYYLLIGAVEAAENLPAGFPRMETGRGFPKRTSQGFVAFSFKPTLVTRDSTVWNAGFELFRAASEIMADPGAEFELRKIDQFSSSRDRVRSVGYTSGSMVRLATGSLRASLIVRDGDRTVATIRATRISRETFTSY